MVSHSQAFSSLTIPSLSFLEFYLFYFLAVLDLHCWMGFSLVVVRGLLIAVASLVAEHGFLGTWASVVVVPRL